MSIVFKKFTGEPVFTLSGFFNKGHGHSYIEYDFDFDSDGFKTKLTLEAELFDIKSLLEGLTYLKDNLKGTFYFQPIISERLKIKFEINDQGQIAIDGNICNPSYSTNLSFKFLSDQSFLVEVISKVLITLSFLTE
jgi:hypothetical protein